MESKDCRPLIIYHADFRTFTFLMYLLKPMQIFCSINLSMKQPPARAFNIENTPISKKKIYNYCCLFHFTQKKISNFHEFMKTRTDWFLVQAGSI